MANVYWFGLEKAGICGVSGKDRKSKRSLRIPTVDLGADGRFYKIFQKLDSLFIEDECARAYISFKEFHQFEKSSGKTFVDFIKFENCIIGW